MSAHQVCADCGFFMSADLAPEAVVASAISTFSAKPISLKASNAFSASLGSVFNNFVTI